jgi:aryl-alcohol dehydrogenase-like predicted oxidoreductase
MQIHNLRDYKTHLPVLRKWKEEGKVRYIGVTTSHGRYHEALKRLLSSEPFDFVQFSYSVAEREAEKELLPLAQEKQIATLINRPFARGELFRAVKGKRLPEWASEIDCESWAQFFLKFVAGHPAVTCLIPATSKPAHMKDNMAAGFGRLPDEKLRRKMAAHIASL